jgi:hypothetical protein
MPDEKPDEKKPEVQEPPKEDDSGDLPPPNCDIKEPEKDPNIFYPGRRQIRRRLRGFEQRLISIRDPPFPFEFGEKRREIPDGSAIRHH